MQPLIFEDQLRYLNDVVEKYAERGLQDLAPGEPLTGPTASERRERDEYLTVGHSNPQSELWWHHKTGGIKRHPAFSATEGALAHFDVLADDDLEHITATGRIDHPQKKITFNRWNVVPNEAEERQYQDTAYWLKQEHPDYEITEYTTPLWVQRLAFLNWVIERYSEYIDVGHVGEWQRPGNELSETGNELWWHHPEEGIQYHPETPGLTHSTLERTGVVKVGGTYGGRVDHSQGKISIIPWKPSTTHKFAPQRIHSQLAARHPEYEIQEFDWAGQRVA
jgi:hypothetical protein